MGLLTQPVRGHQTFHLSDINLCFCCFSANSVWGFWCVWKWMCNMAEGLLFFPLPWKWVCGAFHRYLAWKSSCGFSSYVIIKKIKTLWVLSIGRFFLLGCFSLVITLGSWRWSYCMQTNPYCCCLHAHCETALQLYSLKAESHESKISIKVRFRLLYSYLWIWKTSAMILSGAVVAVDNKCALEKTVQ